MCIRDRVKAFIADHNIKFYVIDGVKIGIETGMGPTRINTILQSAFFKLADIIPEAQAIDLMKAAAKATYGRKGDDVVAKNWAAIDEGAKQIVEVPVSYTHLIHGLQTYVHSLRITKTTGSVVWRCV